MSCVYYKKDYVRTHRVINDDAMKMVNEFRHQNRRFMDRKEADKKRANDMRSAVPTRATDGYEYMDEEARTLIEDDDRPEVMGVQGTLEGHIYLMDGDIVEVYLTSVRNTVCNKRGY